MMSVKGLPVIVMGYFILHINLVAFRVLGSRESAPKDGSTQPPKIPLCSSPRHK